MHIHKVDTRDPRQVRQFIQFPNKLYREDPYYCPMLESGERAALDRAHHPFYRHSTAEFFIAQSEGQVLGRIAAVHNTSHNAHRGVRTAFFSAFDLIDDFQVAQALFEAAFDWARQRGCEDMLGPRGLTGSDTSGVLVEGFDQPAVMGVPYNHPYYDRFIRGLGFEKLTDHLSGYASTQVQLPGRWIEAASRITARRGYRVVSFSTKADLRRWAPAVLAVHEQAFAGTFEWHPSTPEEMDQVANDLIAIADPRLIKLVVKDDNVIGFGFCFPDLAAGLRRARGRMFPFGWWHLRQAQKRSTVLLANGVGMLPAYQNLGGNAVLYTAMWETIQALARFKHIEVVQVNEVNFKSRSDMENLGVRWTKKHRSYMRKL